MPATRHPWLGPGTLSSWTAQCKRGHMQTTITRFLIIAKNDDEETNCKILHICSFHQKKSCAISIRRCKTLEWQMNVKLAWTYVCFFYVLFCSSVLLSKQGTHPRLRNARDTSSLARTRDLISMNRTMQSRAHANYNHKIPGPCQEWRRGNQLQNITHLFFSSKEELCYTHP